MTVSSASATASISALVTPTGVNVSRKVQLSDSVTQSFASANIIYGFTITSTGSSDVATLTLTSGALAKTTGTPDVTRWTGNTSDTSALDLEGQALGTMATLNGLFWTVPSTNTAAVTVSTTTSFPVTVGYFYGIASTECAQVTINTLLSDCTSVITFAATGDSCTGVILGQTA